MCLLIWTLNEAYEVASLIVCGVLDFKLSINLYIVILDDLTLKTAAPLGSANKICIKLNLYCMCGRELNCSGPET